MGECILQSLLQSIRQAFKQLECFKLMFNDKEGDEDEEEEDEEEDDDESKSKKLQAQIRKMTDVVQVAAIDCHAHTLHLCNTSLSSRSSICPPVYLAVNSFFKSSIHSFIHSLIHPFIHQFIH